MIALRDIPVLLADRSEMLRDLGSAFRGEHAKVNAQEIATVVLAAMGVLTAIWLLARFTVWREGRSSFHSPKQLFRKLGAAHGLTLAERQLLLKAARRVNSPSPATLFLRPDLLDAAVKDTHLSTRADELKAIKGKLFPEA